MKALEARVSNAFFLIIIIEESFFCLSFLSLLESVFQVLL